MGYLIQAMAYHGFWAAQAMGILDDRSITWLAVFSVALQHAAIPVLFLVKKRSPITEN